MAPSADYSVEIVDSSGQADMSVSVVGDQVVDLTGASPGDVLTVQGDGTVAPDPPGAPGAHAATHADGGTDEVALAQSQITGLVSDLAAKVPKSLFNASRQRLAVTTDDTSTAWAANAKKTLSIAQTAATPGGSLSNNSTYMIPSDGLYYVGVCVVAVTVPSVIGRALADGGASIIAEAPPLNNTDANTYSGPASCPTTAVASTNAAFSMYVQAR